MFTVTFGMAVVLSIFCSIFLDNFLQLMNTPAECLQYTRDYSFICVLGLIFIYGYNLVSAILRGMGDSKHPFIFIAVATVVNLILDLVFVAGFGMGPAGAALPLSLDRQSAFFGRFFICTGTRKPLALISNCKAFVQTPWCSPSSSSWGFPMILQSAAINFSMLFVNSYINAYGVVASAVTGIRQ